jgi:hypothetical protein
MPITAWDLAHKKCFLTAEELKFKIIKIGVKVGHAKTWSETWWHHLKELDVALSQLLVVRRMMAHLEEIIGLQPQDPEYFRTGMFGNTTMLTNEVKK